MRLVFSVLVACCTLAVGESAEESKDRYLSLPKLEKCNNRFREAEYEGRNFFFSGHDPELKDTRLDWLDSRNTCRQRCMETVTFDSQAKFDFFKDYITDYNIPFFWTSGRLCDFDGCEGRWDLLPKRIKGWLWSANQVQLSDTNKIPPGWEYQPWSSTGSRKRPQPDDAEYFLSQTHEACIGILNNMYNDSIAFHDVACYHKTRFICEDSELLLQEVLEMTNEEAQDESEESSTKSRVVEVESTSRRIEVEKATRNIEPEETSRRMKAVETTTPQIVNAKKTNQSGDGERKTPQRRRKIVRKKLQPEIDEQKIAENEARHDETMEKANSTLTVENENHNERETLNSTDDAKGDEEVIEALETTEIVDAETTTKSTKRSFFRNRGRRTRRTQF